VYDKKAGKSTLRSVGKDYIKVLKSKVFWGYISPYAIIIGAIIAYYSASPFWFVTGFGISHDSFSNLLLPTAGLYCISLLLARQLMERIPVDKILFSGLVVGLAGLAIAIFFLVTGIHGLVAIVVLFSMLGLAGGFIAPCANAECLTQLRHIAAPASALISCYLFVM